MTNESVEAAYSRRAAEYIKLFGSIDAAAELDRARISAWAETVDGRIVDVGCGPGQWTDWLGRLGHDVEGIDPTPAFISEARRRFPSASYRLAYAQNLGVEGASLGGVLAWYSLIHTEPDKITAPLAEFARCLHPGGGLALGFFAGPELRPFDHAVATAYFWPIDTLAGVLESVGFEVLTTAARTDPGVRRQGLITALRAGTTT